MAGFRITDCTARRAPGRLMRRIDKLMRAMIEGRLGPIGLSYVQWATLKMAREGILSTATEVAREFGYTSGATTRLIDGLEERGLIERRRGGADRRVARLEVTASGHAIIDRGLSVAVDLWNEMVADFSQDEADRFVETLAKLLATIEAKSETPRLAEAAE